MTPSRIATRKWFALLVLAATVSLPSIAVSQENVAAGRPVTLEAGSTGQPAAGWPNPTPASPSTITDGIFTSEGQHWQGPDPDDVRTVWWTGTSTIFEIALAGTANITSFRLNGDNNDNYVVSYWNAMTSMWVTAFQTALLPRDIFNGMEIWDFSTSVTTDKLRIQATAGDNFYSVAELQAFGTVVPEPASMALLATGLAALGGGAAARRRRKTANS